MRWAALLAAVAAIGLCGALESRKPAVEAPPAQTQQEPKPAPTIGPQDGKRETRPAHENCGKPPRRIETALCAEIRGAEAAEVQAAAAKDQVNLGWFQVVGLLGSIFVTAAATIYAAIAAKAASDAAEAIPLLERAYVYPLIQEDKIADALDVAAYMASHPMTASKDLRPMPRAKVIFKNFGKTPATLTHGEVTMILGGAVRVNSVDDLPIKYRYVLAEGEESEPFSVSLADPLEPHDAQEIAAGRYTLHVHGFMNYRDIWGRSHGCPVNFSYSPLLKRLHAQVRPGEKPKQGLLSRVLPSHWWPRR